MNSDWPFEDAPNTACITTRFVIDGSKPILLVTHNGDDRGWQFVCGTTDDPDDGRLIGLDCALEIEPRLRELADLPLGWKASRDSPFHKWERLPADE